MSEILVKALFIGEIVVIVNYLCSSDDPHTQVSRWLPSLSS